MNVSVIIPVYNGEAELAQCLGALAKSLVAPLEILVVDDCSCDPQKFRSSPGKETSNVS